MVRTTYLKRLIAKLPKGSKTPQIGTAMELILGALAGALAQLFTIPVSVIATRQQVGKPRKEGAKDEVQDDATFLGVAKEIVEEEGVTGLWLGLKPSLVLTVNPAITYGMFERVKGIVVLAQGTDKMSPALSFLTGALSKTLATIVRTAVHDYSEYCLAYYRLPTRTSWPKCAYKPVALTWTMPLSNTTNSRMPTSITTKSTPTPAHWISSDACGNARALWAGTRVCKRRLSRQCYHKPCCSCPKTSSKNTRSC